MDILNRIKFNSIQLMETKAQQKLNPCRYYLSKVAKQRLRWLYVVYCETNNNITQAANKIGISREWLSKIKSKFEDNHRDPRSLEPESRAPFNTSKRRRISKETEEKIWIEKTPMYLEHLSGQQKRIMELLSARPMPAAEIAKALTTSQSGVRGQLNRLSSMDFLREKGYRMPVVEKKGGVWQIHPEFMVAYAKANNNNA